MIKKETNGTFSLMGPGGNVLSTGHQTMQDAHFAQHKLSNPANFAPPPGSGAIKQDSAAKTKGISGGGGALGGNDCGM